MSFSVEVPPFETGSRTSMPSRHLTPLTLLATAKCIKDSTVIKGVISEVKRLKSMSSLSSYAVKTTGHSLGAALAQLTAMGKKAFIGPILG